jgi:hypothetical protein
MTKIYIFKNKKDMSFVICINWDNNLESIEKT